MMHNEYQALVWFGLVALAAGLRIWLGVKEQIREEKRLSFLIEHGRFPTEGELKKQK